MSTSTARLPFVFHKRCPKNYSKTTSFKTLFSAKLFTILTSSIQFIISQANHIERNNHMKKLVKLHTRFSRLFSRIGKDKIEVSAPPLQSSPAYKSIHKADRETSEKIGNRIVVVVDSTKEANDALQWVLTHTAQKEDTVILLHIETPTNKDSDSSTEVNPRAYGLLYSMKTVCQTQKPGVKVEFIMLKGKEKGRLIVEEANTQKASLLVLGRKRRSLTWRLLTRWRKNQSSKAIADYCIHNANCMTVAVRRKSRRVGGYLITTKRHKNFWLLA